MRGRIQEIDNQIEELAREKRNLISLSFKDQVKQQPVVYRIRFNASPTRNCYCPFVTDFGCFSSRANAEKYVGSFGTKLDNHSAVVTVEAVASETLSFNILDMMDKPVYGHNYS